jgi:hypothetical protein
MEEKDGLSARRPGLAADQSDAVRGELDAIHVPISAVAGRDRSPVHRRPPGRGLKSFA